LPRKKSACEKRGSDRTVRCIKNATKNAGTEYFIAIGDILSYDLGAKISELYT
jgi:hypothetical protein